MIYQTGDLIFAKYRVETLIGKGTLAYVYRVNNLASKTKRALKVLTLGDPGVGSGEYEYWRQYFLLEKQLYDKLNASQENPYLLQVVDLVENNNALLLEMEFAVGGNLTDQILLYRSKGIPFPKDKALRIALEIAYSLVPLHKNHIVHRDLKPTNILFNDTDHVKVSSLGYSQIPTDLSRQQTTKQSISIHPPISDYGSPEQRESIKRIKPSSDVYSIGLLLFEMLTGENYSHINSPARAEELTIGIRQSLIDLLARMLSQNPDERPGDGREAAAELFREMEREEQVQKALLEKKRKESEEWERMKNAELARREGQAINSSVFHPNGTNDIKTRPIEKEFGLKDSEKHTSIRTFEDTEITEETNKQNSDARVHEISNDKNPQGIDEKTKGLRKTRWFYWLSIPSFIAGIAIILILGRGNLIHGLEIKQNIGEKTDPIPSITTKAIPSSSPDTGMILTSELPTQSSQPELIIDNLTTQTKIPNKTMDSSGSEHVLSGVIQNSSFEDSTDWVNKVGESHILGSYSKTWASEGSSSYRITLFGDKVYEFCFLPGMRTSVNQTIDLTAVDEIWFDMFFKPGKSQKDSSGNPIRTKVIAFIDKDQIYQSDDGISGEMIDNKIILNQKYTGKHELKFGLMVMSKFCAKGNSEEDNLSVYFDNIRLISK
ncbi:serine/threonine-protein kinase [Leptolinea tardivitalis]|uniref:non-specific serine/threonine protein kinase n=1 Tax=Leptolinea tardivitalis TaxID=229920 RepID=A0A0N8GM99_9CHLR|nr:serine/threonine-protein kinase [Leptolinea tardivitalis]KPL74706.1 hypothetical protein ADM99_01055 [Leptolinea tardivitalis]GAP22936.1 serine/threonine protein kinase [Leptolinea tardivitalis]